LAQAILAQVIWALALAPKAVDNSSAP